MIEVKDKTKEQIIEDCITELRPFFRADGGDVEFIGLRENTVVVKLLGACSSCSMSDTTVKLGIKESIKAILPEIKEVIAINQ